MTIAAPPTAPSRKPSLEGPEALVKEARDRQRRRRRRLALLLLAFCGLGGIGYGIDRGLSGGHPAPACASSACAGAGAVASSAAPIIVSVLAEPGDLRLSSGPVKIVPGKQTKGLTVVPAPLGLAFKVTLHNTSNSSDTDVNVTLTVYQTVAQRGPNLSHPSYRPWTVETEQAGAIGPHQTEVVTIGNRLRVPIAEATKMNVDVAAVTSGKLAVKRAINYPVIFALP